LFPVDYDQVFKLGDTLTISGERLDLVTGVEFSGQSGSFGINAFVGQSYSNLSLSMPSINPDSGIFRVRDFVSRTSSHDSGINFNIISGFTNDLLPGETMTLSGRNVSGMNVLFPSATGNNLFVSSPNLSNAYDQGVQSITANVPTGIVFGNLVLEGRENRITIQGDVFTPIGVITGVTGFDSSNLVETGGSICLTGINCFDRRFLASPATFVSGNVDGLVGISGSGVFGGRRNSLGVVSLGGLHKYATGTATIGGVSDVFYNEFHLITPTQGTVSGTLFTVDPWMSYEGTVPSFGNSSYDNPDIWWQNTEPSGYNTGLLGGRVEKKILASPDVYQISGKEIIISGLTPSRGSEGEAIQVSGENLIQVQNINFTPIPPSRSNILTGVQSGSNLVPQVGGGSDSVADIASSANFKLTGTTGMIVFVPVVRAGVTSLSYEGAPFGGPVGTFNVVTRGPSVQYDIIPTGDEAPTKKSDRNVNYTIEEDVGGTVFLVTRTKFPDGTTAVISSIPKP